MSGLKSTGARVMRGRRSTYTDANATLWLTMLTLVVLMCDLATGYRAAKEHKVHNIMLYPEKHSWCKPTPIKQVVSHPGCKPIEMENNVCVGACFSFFVPRTIPETPGDDLLYYCDSCQPNSFSWTEVSLECPDNLAQPSLKKNVEVIANCTCLAVQGKRPLLLAADADDSSRESFSGEDEDETILSSLETSNHNNHVQADFQDLVQAGGTVVANKSSISYGNSPPLDGGVAIASDTNTSARERYLKLGEQNPEALLLQAIDDEEEDGGEWDQEEESNLPLLRDEGDLTATSRT